MFSFLQNVIQDFSYVDQFFLLKQVRDLLERATRQQHFESTERTCDQTILTLATTLRKSVTKEIDTEAIVEQLKNGSTEKISAWNNLKVLAIAR